ncbi:MAG: hypothetical protein QF362_04740 [Candidatus Woesearchaeota archaeon]|jgi:MFS family permease|nr:hypothetical protein [Candidatus Woesearchaeota archaeon]MDP7610214.1 hypothetical protein [Candidatus Woesearchaeota archaeon]|tara:strand:- start:487 stop:1647 length:1161 start_codon:yes stop_codon:yes gene_type:complete
MRRNRILLTILLFLVSLGSGLYSLFIPLFLLKQGVEFSYIIVYIMSFCLGGIISGMLFNYIIHKSGIKIPIIARCILEPFIIFILSLYPNFKLPIWVYGITLAIVQFMFWNCTSLILLKSTERHKRGKQQAWILALLWIANIISPFIGGLIINYLGYNYLYAIGLIIVLSSCIPTLLLRQEVVVTGKRVFFPSFKGEIGIHMIITFFRGFSFVTIIFFWVIYLYNILGSELKVGTFSSLGSLLALTAVLIGGYVIDHIKKIIAITTTFSLSALSMFLSIFSTTIPLLFIFNLTNRFTHQSTQLISDILFHHEIEDKDVPSYLSESVISFCLGGIVLSLFAFFFSYKLIFIIASLGLLTALGFSTKLKNLETQSQSQSDHESGTPQQ